MRKKQNAIAVILNITEYPQEKHVSLALAALVTHTGLFGLDAARGAGTVALPVLQQPYTFKYSI